MSSRIRADEAGPGSSQPAPENQDRQRTSPEPADERSEFVASDSPEPEEASQRPSDDDREASGEEGERKPRESDPDYQKRIDQLTRERYEARRERDEARAQMEQWRREQQRQQQPTPDQEAEQRAYQRMQNERLEADFNRDCNTLWERGVDEYGEEMNQAKRGLDAVGWGNRPDALAALTALPDGHRIYRELATDLDNAARILSLPPMRMAVELARMSGRDNSNPLNVSRETNREPAATRAPQPLRPVGGNSARAERPLEQVSMAEFIRRRDRDERGSRIRR